MLELNVGKSHQIASFMVGTATALSGVFNASYNRRSVRGVCALVLCL